MGNKNLVQSVDTKAELHIIGRETPDAFKDLAVTEVEIERSFAGGGSTAEVEVVFEGFLSEEEKEAIGSYVNEGIRDENFIPFTSDKQQRDAELLLTVDVRVTTYLPSNSYETQERLFTGNVIKVTENNERTVTFEALDRRHQLNRNMVQMDIAEPTPVSQIVESILGKSTPGGLQLDDNEYKIGFVEGYSDVMISNQHYGVEVHATVFEVLQDLAQKANATIHIDNHNRIHFVNYPRHTQFGGDEMPPIVEWESGDEETEQDVIVESPYDETGLGLYPTISTDVNRAQDETLKPGQVTKSPNVFSRQAVENVREHELISNELMKNSGVIRCVGDPRVGPYDEFVIDESVLDGFAPISEGEYIGKTVRHIITQSEGYITEIELGNNPEELFEQFTGQASDNFQQRQEQAVSLREAEEGISLRESLSITARSVTSTAQSAIRDRTDNVVADTLADGIANVGDAAADMIFSG